MNEGFEYAVFRDLFVMRTGPGVPPQEFWDGYCHALGEAAKVGPVRILIDARAGQKRPNPSQRQQLEDAAPSSKVRAAVVSDNTLVRMVTKVFSWAGYQTQGFMASQIEEAALYLNCTYDERKWIQDLTSDGANVG